MRYLMLSISLFFTSVNFSFGQLNIRAEWDKCGGYLIDLKSAEQLYGDSWGYNYDSLINDLSKWDMSHYVDVSTIGKSTIGRDIHELTISNFNVHDANKQRIYIHARTHPGEIQSFWVTDKIINFLLSEAEIGSYLRDRCIFHVIPMYNPDGVELEFPRENANGIDIESNWNSDTLEIEVANLQTRFNELMQEENPIKIALNMHSAYACKRFFVYHHENGTSANYADMEEFYIESTRSHFIEGIEPYSYYVSWTSGTPAQYPESWWWLNFGDRVMALTYEDMNCSSAGFYNKTAFAILHGISDYLGLGLVGFEENFIKTNLEVKAFPNPFEDYIHIEWNNFDAFDKAVIFDVTGRVIKTFGKEEAHKGIIEWDGKDNSGNATPAGTYIFRITVNNEVKVIRIIKQ